MIWVQYRADLDPQTCWMCESLNGVVAPLEKSGGVIPAHPGCRCQWVVVSVGSRPPGRLAPWLDPADYGPVEPFSMIVQGLKRR